MMIIPGVTTRREWTAGVAVVAAIFAALCVAGVVGIFYAAHMPEAAFWIMLPVLVLSALMFGATSAVFAWDAVNSPKGEVMVPRLTDLPYPDDGV